MERLCYKVTPPWWVSFLLLFKPSHHSIDQGSDREDPWFYIRFKILFGVIYVLEEGWF